MIININSCHFANQANIITIQWANNFKFLNGILFFFTDSLRQCTGFGQRNGVTLSCKRLFGRVGINIAVCETRFGNLFANSKQGVAHAIIVMMQDA